MSILRKKTEEESPVKVEVERRRRFGKEHDESNWLISYADMMTLLCVFYIMMFSMSKINVPEFEHVKKEMAKHFNSKYESPTEDLGKFINQVVQEAGVSKEVLTTSDGVSVSVAFQSTLFFDSLSAEMSDQGRGILAKFISGLMAKQTQLGKSYKIVVEGHTDSQPVMGGAFPSNWELSSSRATRVIRLFIDGGFDARNLLAIGYSDTQPLAESRNLDGSWNLENLAKNRRVMVRILMPDVDTIPWKVKGNEPAPASVKGPAPATAEPSVPAQAPAPVVEPVTTPETTGKTLPIESHNG